MNSSPLSNIYLYRGAAALICAGLGTQAPGQLGDTCSLLCASNYLVPHGRHTLHSWRVLWQVMCLCGCHSCQLLCCVDRQGRLELQQTLLADQVLPHVFLFLPALPRRLSIESAGATSGTACTSGTN